MGALYAATRIIRQEPKQNLYRELRERFLTGDRGAKLVYLELKNALTTMETPYTQFLLFGDIILRLAIARQVYKEATGREIPVQVICQQPYAHEFARAYTTFLREIKKHCIAEGK